MSCGGKLNFREGGGSREVSIWERRSSNIKKTGASWNAPVTRVDQSFASQMY